MNLPLRVAADVRGGSNFSVKWRSEPPYVGCYQRGTGAGSAENRLSAEGKAVTLCPN